MARIDIKSSSTGGSGGGNLQLQGGASMTTTLTAVTDTSNTASPLKLSTTGVQSTSKIQITTADTNYIDAEDNSGNNRFTVGRDPASQQVNVDFASNPTGSTTNVGAIRTYVDGVNLSEVMTFREDGRIQIGSTSASAMYWDNVNNRLGIGTNVPTTLLNLSGSSEATPSGTTGGILNIIGSATNALIMGSLSTNPFGLYIQGGGSGIYPLSLNPNGGNVGIATTNPTAKLHIVGSGSTSATTSLLVQNSSGQTKFFVDDSSVGANCCIGNLINGYSSLQWNANSVGFGLISGGGLGAKLSNNASFVVSDSSSPTNDTSAKLIVNSTSAGFLPPRMTDAQRAAIASPAEGLLLFNTTNKGVAYRDGTNWGYLSGAKQTATGSGGTLAISFASGNIVDLTLTGSTTLTFAGHVVGTYIIQVTQGGIGSYTLTYPASVKWSGGTAPTLTTTVGKTDILTFYHDGTSFFGTYSLNY